MAVEVRKRRARRSLRNRSDVFYRWRSMHPTRLVWTDECSG